MKSHKSTRELLIIRLICYSFIAWMVTYVYLNSWTGLNVNKIEQERINRIEKKAALKKSLDVLIEAGFSDDEVLDKQMELFTYFLGEKEIDESKIVLDNMERTLSTSTSLSRSERVKAQCLLIMGKQYLNDFDKAAVIAIQSKNELNLALKNNEIEPLVYERLSGILENNLAVSQYLQSGCEENIEARRKKLTQCILNFAQAQKTLGQNSQNKAYQQISSDNLATARREILFDRD
ncbi:MAG: hypothetical protein SFY67_02875 [Candidatus Melainabacteria bacterium]|nr:hypothetical protein [Candidatus Melainabacteria bacterium]